jgi:hypothetical protein
MDTLRELRDAELQHERELCQSYKDGAARVIQQYGTMNGWTEEEIVMVRDMLGVDIPASVFGTVRSSFNHKAG